MVQSSFYLARRDRDMQRDNVRWLTGGLATILALVVSSTVALGDYTTPNQTGNLMGEVSAFVGDFGSWNASMNNLPEQFLASTPTSQQGNAVVMLFLLWLQEGGMGSAGQGSASSHSGSTTLSGAPLPSPSGNPSGSIVSGQLNGGLPSNGGNDPPGLGGNSGSSSFLSQLPSSSGGSGNQLGSIPALGGTGGGSGESPFDATPEPASVTLLAIGGSGMLMGLWIRRRRRV